MQSIWKHVQQHPDILQRYKTETQFAFHIRYLASLAFVPAAKVVKSFEEVEDLELFKENKTLLQPLLQYFQRTWVGEKRRNRRSSPLFSIDLWNVHQAVTEEWHKTNNACEGFNRSLSSMLMVTHPTIWKFIKGLLNHQSLTEVRERIHVMIIWRRVTAIANAMLCNDLRLRPLL